MNFYVLTLFPELFPGPLGCSVVGAALARGLWNLHVVPLREFSDDKHHRVDSPAFGGGAGMVLQAPVIHKALSAVKKQSQDPLRFIHLSPRGIPLKHHHTQTWSQASESYVLLCGRYEGVDQRVLDHWNIEEYTLGDIVLSGGEIPAMALIDSCLRHLPGVLGNAASLKEESFCRHLLEYPHYTHPRTWEGHNVPEVLLSGHHQQIRQWRQTQSERLTYQRRPDLWHQYLKDFANPSKSQRD